MDGCYSIITKFGQKRNGTLRYTIRPYDEILPWDHLDYGITKDFLIREDQRAQGSRTTENCRRQCSGCGANHLLGGACFEADESVL